MGWFSDFVSNPLGTVVDTVSNPVQSVVDLSHSVTAPIADPFSRGDVTAGDVAIAAAVATGGAGLAGYGPLAGVLGGEAIGAGAVLDASAAAPLAPLTPLEAVTVGTSAVASVEAGTAAASGGFLGGLFDNLSWPSWLTPGVAMNAAQIGANLTAPKRTGYVYGPSGYTLAPGYRPAPGQIYDSGTVYASPFQQPTFAPMAQGYGQGYQGQQASAQSITPGVMLMAAAVAVLALKKG